MIERTTVEALIRDAYAARHRGDLDALMDYLHPDCSYRLAGGPAEQQSAHAHVSPVIARRATWLT